MRSRRSLSAEEAALWSKVAQTVKPLERRMQEPADPPEVGEGNQPNAEAPLTQKIVPTRALKALPPLPPRSLAGGRSPRAGEDRLGLDSSWERRIDKGTLEPDFSLDLHGAGLDAAYVRLMRGLTQAKSMGARVVLIVTGKPRPVEAADRGQARGAIRAKIGDWLVASEHASDIAAIRGAHRRHGGQGALYVVLKRRR